MKLSSLNPFRNLTRPREVWAWSMYDLANQSFTLLINTLLFPVFFREIIVGGDPARGDRMWSSMVAASMLIVVIASPLIGALADVRGLRKRYLIATGLICATATCALGVLGGGTAAIAFGVWIRSFGRPMFVLLMLVMILLGTTELGTDGWIQDIMGSVLEDPIKGTLFLVYTSAIMFVLRFFAGPIVHRVAM